MRVCVGHLFRMRRKHGTKWGTRIGKEKDELEEKISKERELGMLLGVLEGKETVKMSRIGEVKRMVNELRCDDFLHIGLTTL